MRVCYVTPFIEVPNTSGTGTGGSAHALEVALGLQELGISVELVCSGPHGAVPRNMDGIRVWPVLSRASATAVSRDGQAVRGGTTRRVAGAGYRLGRSLVHARRIQRIARASGCRLIYERANGADYGGSLAAAAMRLPLVLEVNDLSWWSRSLRWASAIVSPSLEPLPEEVRAKAHALAWGVNLQRFRPSVVPAKLDGLDAANDEIFLHASSCLPWHGLIETVEAVRLVRDRYPQVRVLCIGNGPLREAAQRRAEEVGVSSLVSFAAHVPYEQMPAYMTAASVGLAPYSTALSGARARMSTPIKVLEYLACGRPVAVSANANRVGVVSGETGWCMPDAGPESIAAAIEAAIAARSRRGEMSQLARAHAANFSWGAHVRRLAEVFDAVSAPEPAGRTPLAQTR